jgi:hypothetical protein
MRTDDARILSGSLISTDTSGSGGAGQIDLGARSLLVDSRGATDALTGITSDANPGSLGNAGSVTVTVAERLDLTGEAVISASTFGGGRAGDVSVRTGELHMRGEGGRPSLISSSAQPGSRGDSGSVSVSADGLVALEAGAAISTDTFGTGNAGNVAVRSGALRIDGGSSSEVAGIFSAAGGEASGFVGNVDVDTEEVSIVNGGAISIAASQTIPASRLGERPDSRIYIEAQRLHMDGGARITTQSTGNVPASAIEIDAVDMLIEGASRITTEANEADGGPIAIQGYRLWLRDSLITTSVLGSSGDGGNIRLEPDFLILEGGFIQANTAAPQAKGGDIFIDTRALIASGGRVQIGGAERREFQPGSGRNVIQAAAPGGEQGTISITAPELDISGALVDLATPFVDPTRLIEDPCAAAAGAPTSSLVQGGRGGIPATPEDPATMSFGGDRLDRLLSASPQPSQEGAIETSGGDDGRMVFGGIGHQPAGCRVGL